MWGRHAGTQVRQTGRQAGSGARSRKDPTARSRPLPPSPLRPQQSALRPQPSASPLWEGPDAGGRGEEGTIARGRGGQNVAVSWLSRPPISRLKKEKAGGQSGNEIEDAPRRKVQDGQYSTVQTVQ
jgi:hypothetical protein